MDLRGKRIVVMGLGRFGGGVGVTRFLVGQGARVLVTDRLPADRLDASLRQLADLSDVEYRLGEHRETDFTAADLVVVNPAVNPADNPYVRAARDAGVPLTSEIRLLVQHLPNRERTLGVTGTAGKSTVTAMIGHILRKTTAPPVHVGGNLGGSLLGELDRIRPDDWVVLELSSFMLEGLREDGWSPHIAVITNFAPNHLDWHGTLDAYRRAKQAILDHQQPQGDVAILGPHLREHFTPRVRDARWHDDGAIRAAAPLPLLVPGFHNQLNATLAVDAAVAAGAGRDHAINALRDFAGLPHRLQLVAEHAGVRYFNDSKSTTPESAMLALRSFDPGIVHVILGGYDKGSDLTALAAFAAQHARAIYTVGATGSAIADAARAAAGGADVVPCDDLESALAQITRHVRAGDVVLLSPGCASWDQFEHFEQRGARFVEAVLRHTTEAGAVPKR